MHVASSTFLKPPRLSSCLTFDPAENATREWPLAANDLGPANCHDCFFGTEDMEHAVSSIKAQYGLAACLARTRSAARVCVLRASGS
eukprot:2698603-Amphidinium_carterae.1